MTWLSVADALVRRLAQFRYGMVRMEGGLIDADRLFVNWWDTVSYLPRALMIGFLAPFPPEWLATDGATGAMRLFSAIEMLLIYALIVPTLRGAWRVCRGGDPVGWGLVGFILLTCLVVTFTVPNLGTLFRLRQMWLLPMLVLAAIGLTPVGPRR